MLHNTYIPKTGTHYWNVDTVTLTCFHLLALRKQD